MLVKDVIEILEGLAPSCLALEGDPTGLQVGSPRWDVKGIMVALDYNRQVLQEALEAGANLVITHHPFIFRPLSRLDASSPLGSLTCETVKRGITLFTLHSNLDVVEGGVSTRLARALGLGNLRVLKPTGRQELFKVAVFVPLGYQGQVREAMARAGAGWIGDYSHCTFNLQGTGTFKPLAGANPFLGETGRLEEVQEVRIETIVTGENRHRVVEEMVQAHPYEEVAYDLYPLANGGQEWGLGRIGYLKEEKSLREMVETVKGTLQVERVKVVGRGPEKVKKVAVCGGSGGRLMEIAVSRGAQLLITGDIGYHQAQEAQALGLVVIDPGHDATERVVIPFLAEYLHRRLEEKGVSLKVNISQAKTSPWGYF